MNYLLARDIPNSVEMEPRQSELVRAFSCLFRLPRSRCQRDDTPGKVVGKLSYTNSENVKQIAIGDNTLTWDADGLWYNASVNLDGYQLQLDSFSYVFDSMSVYMRIAQLINSATLDSFHPNVAFYNGLLDQSGQWFGSVPIIRGHV